MQPHLGFVGTHARPTGGLVSARCCEPPFSQGVCTAKAVKVCFFGTGSDEYGLPKR
jgi:hypothetical protein